MKRLIPVLILAISLSAASVYAQTPANQDSELAEFTRFAKQATTQQKIKLLDELVRETNAGLANENSEVFESIQLSHHYPKSHALDYTLAIRPQLAQGLDIKRFSSPKNTAEFQTILRQAMQEFCDDADIRTVFKALGIREMRLLITLNQRIINQSRVSFSQCYQQHKAA